MVSPVDVVNTALFEGMTRTTINGFPPIDNSPAAVAGNIFYTQKTQMVLRGALWDFARRQAPLTVLRQAIINGVTSANPPPQPWLWQYLMPVDCLRTRFLLQFIQPAPAGVPLTTGPSNAINPAYANTAVPYVIAADIDPVTGAPRKTILTNMPNAQLVYTCDLSQFPDMWDSMFRSANTATLAAFLVAALNGDKAQMELQVKIATAALAEARAMNGNEQMNSQDHIPDWIRARASGSTWFGYNGGTANGSFYDCGWDSCSFPTGLTY